MSQGIPRARQTVSAMLTECQMLHPAGSVALPAFLSGRKLSPSSRLDSSHFILSLCATGTSQAATWCWSLEGMNLNNYMCGFFRGTAWDSRSFSYRLNLCWFLQLEVMGTYLPGTGTLGLGPWCGAGTPCSLDIPPKFLSTICWCGTSPFCLSAPATNLDGCGFFNSIVVTLLFNSISASSE